MYGSQLPWVELYWAVLEYGGTDIYSDLLDRWPGQNPGEWRWLADFSRRADGTDNCWQNTTDEELCRLYAAWRVTTTLLLRFQVGRADGTDYRGPAITVAGYKRFHEAMGFRIPTVDMFHPFFHEIVGVQQTSPAGSPVKAVEQIWPALMLGSMVFSRAGCVVSAGESHIVKDVAERSKLYWTFRRKDRQCADESHGWGSNSQWRTRLRRDYRSHAGFWYNVDGKESLTMATGTVDGIDILTMIELVRNRCLVRTAIDDSDLYPYRYTYFETF
jgi:hypothetical protein